MNGANAVRDYDGPRTNATAVPTTLLGEVTGEVGQLAERAYRLRGAVREFNDGIHGTQPEALTGGAQKAPEPSTRAQSLRRELAALNEAMAGLEKEVDRLNRI